MHNNYKINLLDEIIGNYLTFIKNGMLDVNKINQFLKNKTNVKFNCKTYWIDKENYIIIVDFDDNILLDSALTVCAICFYFNKNEGFKLFLYQQNYSNKNNVVYDIEEFVIKDRTYQTFGTTFEKDIKSFVKIISMSI